MKRNVILILVLATVMIGIMLIGGCGNSRPKEETISFNQMIAGSIRSGVGTSSYAVDGKEGRNIFLDVRDLSEGSANFVLTDPDDFQVFSTTAHDYRPDRGNTEPVELDKDGMYILTITGSDDVSSEYKFVIWDVDPLVIDGENIQLDNLIRGKIDIIGQVVEYILEAEAGQSFSLDVHSISEGSVDFILTAPDGLEVFNTTAHDYRPDRGNMEFTLNKEGTYILILDPQDIAAPQFEFVIWDVDPVIQGGEISFDALIRGNTEMPGQVVEYTFTADVGQSFSLDVHSISEGSVDFILTGPDGLEVFNTTAHDYRPDRGNMEFITDREGTYILILDPDGTATPQYEFTIDSEGHDETAESDIENDAYIVTGYEVDADNFKVISEETTFEAGKKFYFVFYNNTSFGTTEFTLQILDSSGEEVLFEQPYEVEAHYDVVFDQIWADEPGEYIVACLLDGEVRATHVVTIE